MTTSRMPTLYLSHGAPILADDPIWPGQLAAWASDIPRPTAILVVSAHWEDAPLALGATRTVPLYYDFWGFDDKYYHVTYPAPGAPELAAKVRGLLRSAATPSRMYRTVASTTARTYRWSRCTRTRTSPCCKSPCLPSTLGG